MRLASFLLLPALIFSTYGCAAEDAPFDAETVEAQADALSGTRAPRPNTSYVAAPANAPAAFYPSESVGEYYGPCGPLSATWLMTWYVGRGPGGSGNNQVAYERVSSYAQGMRVLPGASPTGLVYAINRMLDGSWFADLARSKAGATIEEIRDLIASDRPVITLIQWWDADATLPTLHYVTLFGYRRVGDSYVYVAHDNGSFVEIEEAALETARDTSFYNRAIVWMDRPVPKPLATE